MQENVIFEKALFETREKVAFLKLESRDVKNVISPARLE
jgi:hypothetical protein